MLIAQSYDYRDLFARTYGGRGDDWVYSVIPTSDWGLAMAGYTKSFGAGAVDVFVIKLTTLGELEWARTFGKAGSEYGHSIIQAADGWLLVAGYREEPGENRTDPLIHPARWNGQKPLRATALDISTPYPRPQMATWSRGGQGVARETLTLS